MVYFGVVIWFSLHTPDRSVIIEDSLAMQRIAFIPELILAGVWASTLSSALGSVLAAPRTLQAIAQDRVVPRWMASTMGHPTEPRMGVALTGAITLIVIWLGDLNAVAPVISMFFLNTYGITNLAAGIETLVGNPSYRPRLNIPWYLSLLGALGCYGAMFLINSAATFIAIVVSVGIYVYLERRQLESTWGDVRTGVWFALSRIALLQLEKRRWHVKNWRPNLMVFTGQPHNRRQLVEVANWISRGRGIVTFFQFIIGDVRALSASGIREREHEKIRAFIRNNNMAAFAEVEIVNDFRQGITAVAQAHGIGGLESNAALLGWSGTVSGRAQQMALTRELYNLRKSTVFLNFDSKRGFGKRQIINVWWQGRGGNADLMLLLAHIIRQHRSWEGAKLRLLQVVDNEDEVGTVRAMLLDEIRQVRVKAEPHIIVNRDEESISALITRQSVDADLTFLGMQLPTAEDEVAYARALNELVQAVGTVLIVRNAQPDEDLLSTG